MDTGQAKLGDRLLRLLAHLPTFEDVQRPDLFHDLLAEEKVPPEAELIDDGEILVDGLYADRPRVGRRLEAHILAHEPEFSGRGLLVAGKNLEQRRLAGTVVADER